MENEVRANYGTTAEVAITFIAEDGSEKVVKLPDAKDSSAIQSAAISFANLATNSDTAVIGVSSNSGLVVPTAIKIDLIETTRTKIYDTQG